MPMKPRRPNTFGALRHLYYEVTHGICHWCGRKTTIPSTLPRTPRRDLDATVDHVVALSRGGSKGRENLVLSCWFCNRLKRDKTPEEWTAFRAANPRYWES